MAPHPRPAKVLAMYLPLRSTKQWGFSIGLPWPSHQDYPTSTTSAGNCNGNRLEPRDMAQSCLSTGRTDPSQRQSPKGVPLQALRHDFPLSSQLSKRDELVRTGVSSRHVSIAPTRNWTGDLRLSPHQFHVYRHRVP